MHLVLGLHDVRTTCVTALLQAYMLGLHDVRTTCVTALLQSINTSFLPLFAKLFHLLLFPFNKFFTSLSAAKFQRHLACPMFMFPCHTLTHSISSPDISQVSPPKTRRTCLPLSSFILANASCSYFLFASTISCL